MFSCGSLALKMCHLSFCTCGTPTGCNFDACNIVKKLYILPIFVVFYGRYNLLGSLFNQFKVETRNIICTKNLSHPVSLIGSLNVSGCLVNCKRKLLPFQRKENKESKLFFLWKLFNFLH